LRKESAYPDALAGIGTGVTNSPDARKLSRLRNVRASIAARVCTVPLPTCGRTTTLFLVSSASGTFGSSAYDPAIAQPSTLRGAHIGFVGFGHIGRRAWELFRAFGCTGAAVTGSGRVTDVGLDWAGDTGELDRMLSQCDVAVVSAPLSDRTEGMIGAAQLAALGPDGVLINVGRGPLVAERALYDALAGGVIAAAAIDVWYRYPTGDDVSPPGDLPFADLPNLLMTPHSSGVTRDTFAGRVDDVVANIGRLGRGEPLRNVVHGG
jgi:phosphoglycerate dehydrogenase-like enzyme